MDVTCGAQECCTKRPRSFVRRYVLPKIDWAVVAPNQITQAAATGEPAKKPVQVEVKSPGVIGGLFSKTRDAISRLVVLPVIRTA